jgi:two-component system cell cycle sensor histidine kinase/response regulator CckA
VHASADDLSDAHGTPDPAPGDYVFVEVSDSGPGIDDAARSRIFEPFFTTKFTGRGLGLAAVHGIVHAHRGAIKLDSRLGEGTAFRVLFPQSGRRTEPPLREPAPDGAAVSSTTRAATTVLVVDDDEAVLELAGTFLARADFRVLTARGGVEALRIFEERGRGIDVVVLDLSMPDLDGPETFKELRRRHSNVPVILTSGYSEEWAAKAAPAEQVAAFLGKPYEPEELIEQVRLAVSR